MTKDGSQQKPYKQVVIFGPDHNGALEGDRKRASTFGNDCLVIGDGKRTVTLGEIEKKLTGKIDSATRIDIAAHGGKGDNHVIQLDQGLTKTSDLFRRLAELMVVDQFILTSGLVIPLMLRSILKISQKTL